ncbi:MAG TPA: N-acetylmuramic acid 6-phosphate etherase, partial [Candidatus Wallbacteria bacterium]|nr:N-acetylmuramic acid 6-phosphate etherase [Candidatus Wallbacteria bacterium]
YENYMVDLTPSCKKLVERGCRIISDICGVSRKEAEEVLKMGKMNVKTAILMRQKGITLKEAREKLKKCGGFLRQALKK